MRRRTETPAMRTRHFTERPQADQIPLGHQLLILTLFCSFPSVCERLEKERKRLLRRLQTLKLLNLLKSAYYGSLERQSDVDAKSKFWFMYMQQI